MSEDTERPDEAGATEQASGGEESQWPSWIDGEPDLKRLVSYADNPRSERGDLKSRLEQSEGVWDDEEAVRQRLRDKLSWEIEDADDDDSTDDDDLVDDQERRLRTLEQQAQANAERERADAGRRFRQQFDEHLNELAAPEGGQKVTLSKRDRLAIWAESAEASGGAPTVAETEKAYKALLADREAERKRIIAEFRESKLSPHVPSSGTPSNGEVPDLDDRTARRRHMLERALAAESQQQ